MTPGGALPTEGTTSSNQGFSISVDRRKDNHNNFMIDGVDNNDTLIGRSIPPSRAWMQLRSSKLRQELILRNMDITRVVKSMFY